MKQISRKYITAVLSALLVVMISGIVFPTNSVFAASVSSGRVTTSWQTSGIYQVKLIKSGSSYNLAYRTNKGATKTIAKKVANAHFSGKHVAYQPGAADKWGSLKKPGVYYVYNMETKKSKKFTSQKVAADAWNDPVIRGMYDKWMILQANVTEGGKGFLYRVNVETGKSTGSTILDPRLLSVQSGRYLYYDSSNSKSGLHRMDIATGKDKLYLKKDVECFYGNDSNFYYICETSGKEVIYRCKPDGSKSKKIASLSKKKYKIWEIYWMNDKEIYYSVTTASGNLTYRKLNFYTMKSSKVSETICKLYRNY